MKENKILKGITHPSKVMNFLLDKPQYKWMCDETYLIWQYKKKIGRKLNLENPKTFNEKLQWLKLYDRKLEYSTMVDKVEVRKYIKEIIGEEYLIPCLGVWENANDIDFAKLPNQFVLKCNHNSGLGMVICKDKCKLDIKNAREKLNKGLKQEYFWNGREWPYKNVKPRIICEKHMVDESEIELKDYKFMCFNGVVKLIQVMSGRNNGNYYINHYDINWKKLNIGQKKYIESTNNIRKPKNLDKMIFISEKLSQNTCFSRIDLYNVNDKIYFGEITFFPVSGYVDFSNKEIDYFLGGWLNLPSKIEK